MNIKQLDNWYKRSSLSKNTKKNYANDIRSFILFGAMHCKQHNKQHDANDANDALCHQTYQKQLNIFKDWLLTKKLPARARAISAMKNFRKFCQLPDYDVRTPRLTKKIPRITAPNHTMQILHSIRAQGNWTDIRNYTIALIMYSCGLRVSECLMLKNRDLEQCIKNNFLSVLGKGDKMRMVPVLSIAIDSIKEYLSVRPLLQKNHDYAFVSVRGMPLNVRDVQRFLSKFNITPHVMRHNFATDMINNGANITTIRKLLGHANMATTAKYTHVSFKAIKQQFDKSNL